MDNNNAKKDLVSVIIANYNYGSFLKFTIESLVRQTYSSLNIELVVVDDGSTDSSKEELAKLHDLYEKDFESFTIMFLDKNAGKLNALNIGIEKLHGVYTIILDSDDYLEDDYVEKTLNSLLNAREENPKVSFAYTDCKLIDKDGAYLDYGKSTAFETHLIESCSYIPECAITTTSALKEALPFDVSIRTGTKHHKWVRIIRAGHEGVYLPEPLFYYRMHENNISNIGKKILKDIQNGKKKSRILSGYWPVALKDAY